MNIKETMQQLGLGLNGALAYTGARPLYKEESTKEHDGRIAFNVNGKRGYKWVQEVKLEWNDTYTITLTSVRGTKIKELNKRKNVYCDELQEYFENMYDLAIREHNSGMIHFGV